MRIPLPQTDYFCESLVDVLQYRALHQPDAVIYQFISDAEIQSITYNELAQRAQAIAATLQQQKISPGERAILIYPPGMEFISAFFGCLYAGVIAVPVYPPQNSQLVEKLQRVIDNSRPRILLATTDIIKKFRQLTVLKKLSHTPILKQMVKHYWPSRVALTEWDLEAMSWLATDTISTTLAMQWKSPPLSSEQLAFLQYTSGSTHFPKGTMVSHGNLLHNLSLIFNAFNIQAHSKGLSWLPPYHDMGLIGGMLEPIFCHCPSIILSPLQFIRHPGNWLRWITTSQATITGAPNFAFDYCVNKISEKEKEQFDLSSLEIVFNGAEPIHIDTLERFYQAFKGCGFRKEAFYPCYGLAEATLLVSGATYLQGYHPEYVSKTALQQHKWKAIDKNDSDARILVSSGCLFQEACIVHPTSHHVCQGDEIGEIWIRSPSVTQGYWGQAEETKANFQAHLADDTEDFSYLRTGDLGFLANGELFVTGRIKDIIIIHGINYYPQDIEYTVSQSHSLIRSGCAIAFSRESKNREELIVICEVNNIKDLSQSQYRDICESILKAVVNQYMLSVNKIVLIPPRQLPKTTSGKVRRQYTKEQLLANKLTWLYIWQEKDAIPVKDAEEPATPFEEELCFMLSELLGRTVTVTDHFYAIGGDSLVVMQVLNRINYLYQINLDVNVLLTQATVRDLAKQIAQHVSEKNTADRVTNDVEFSTPDFIQHIAIPVEHMSTDKVNSEIEIQVIKLLEKGFGFWKTDFHLEIEYAKNKSADHELNDIITNKNAIFSYLEKDKKYYPLSFSQQMMCAQSEIYKNTFYQLVIPFFITKNMNKHSLEKALNHVIKRHEILRTIISTIQHTWAQVILPVMDVRIDYQDLSLMSSEEQQEKIGVLLQQGKAKQFVLAAGPLFAMAWIKLAQDNQLIIFTVHHAIFDALSMPVFIRELMLSYEAYEANLEPMLPKLRAQYSHFVLEQRGISDTAAHEEINWWKTQLQDAPLQCHIPSDKIEKHSQQAGIVSYFFHSVDQVALLEFCKTNNITITVLILTAVYILLHKVTQETDIVIGTILNQRNKLEFEDSIGDFNNIVPLRLRLSDQLTGIEFLEAVKNMFIRAYTHQKLPFNQLLRHLAIKRNTANLPLYNIFLDSINFDAFNARSTLDYVKFKFISPKTWQINSIMDLFFFLIKETNTLSLHCIYNEGLLKKETIKYDLQTLNDILLTLTKHPTKKLAEYHHVKTKLSPSPVFFLPGIDGQVDIFSRITADLTQHRCYAIKYKGLEENTMPYQSIKDIANNVIQVMESVAPLNNATLVGLSTGGVVAFEVLHQLQAKGMTFISQLVLLDSPAPMDEKDKNALVQDLDTSLLGLLMQYAATLFGKETSQTISVPQLQEEASVYQWIQENTTMILPSMPYFQRWLGLMRANMTAYLTYIAIPYLEKNVQVTYIASADACSPLNNVLINKVAKEAGWKMLFPHITMHCLSVSNTHHFSLFTGKNIATVADLLKKIIK